MYFTACSVCWRVVVIWNGVYRIWTGVTVRTCLLPGIKLGNRISSWGRAIFTKHCTILSFTGVVVECSQVPLRKLSKVVNFCIIMNNKVMFLHCISLKCYLYLNVIDKWQNTSTSWNIMYVNNYNMTKPSLVFISHSNVTLVIDGIKISLKSERCLTLNY